MANLLKLRLFYSLPVSKNVASHVHVYAGLDYFYLLGFCIPDRNDLLVMILGVTRGGANSFANIIIWRL